MRVFVTGVCGQLGFDCINELVSRGYETIGSDIFSDDRFKINQDVKNTVKYVKLDITKKEDVLNVVSELKPDAIIHCAAWTAVDAAEEEKNKEKVYAINSLGTRYISEAANKNGAKMIYISTDYVFDGSGEKPWEPDDNNFAPLNYYGLTKLEGEKAVSSVLKEYFIVRIAWVFGRNGNNFIKTMINVGKTRDSVSVVCDQIGTPTYTFDLARLLIDMIETEKYGFYHVTNEGGFISWYDFCLDFYNKYGLNTKVIPVTTEQYGISKAKRPRNSRLDKSKLIEMGFKPLPTWQDAVNRYLNEINI